MHREGTSGIDELYDFRDDGMRNSDNLLQRIDVVSSNGSVRFEAVETREEVTGIIPLPLKKEVVIGRKFPSAHLEDFAESQAPIEATHYFLCPSDTESRLVMYYGPR